MSSDESSVKLASELLASLDGAVNPVLGSGAPSQSAAVHDPNGFQIVQVGERGRLTLAPRPAGAVEVVAAAPDLAHALHSEAPTPARDLEKEFFDCSNLDMGDLVRLQQWWPRGFSHTLYQLPVSMAHHTLQHEHPALSAAMFRATEPEPVGSTAFPAGRLQQPGPTADGTDAVDEAITPVQESWLPEALQGDANSSSSVLRAATSTAGDNATERRLRGSTRNQPFRAGGLAPEAGISDTDASDDAAAKLAVELCDQSLFTTDPHSLLKVAPGLASGLTRQHVAAALGDDLATPVTPDAVASDVASAGLADADAVVADVIAAASWSCHAGSVGPPRGAGDGSGVGVTTTKDGEVSVTPVPVDQRPSTPPPPPGTDATSSSAKPPMSAYSTGHNPTGLLSSFKSMATDEDAIADAKRRIVLRQRQQERQARDEAVRANAAARAGAATNVLPDAEEEAKSAAGGGLLGADMEELWLASDTESEDDGEASGDDGTAESGAGAGAGAGAGSGAGDVGLPKVTVGGAPGGDDDDGFDATMNDLLAATTAAPTRIGDLQRGDAGKHRGRGGERGGGQSWARTELVPEEELARHEATTVPPVTYPFTLDHFQRQAVYHLEHNDFVFVAAHTSAGKTVVAEYAMALAASHMTRCVYTSPIKALSNQKFRDLRKKFGDVGLITGDVSVNPDAACLIMTTEILRSMLYNGADLIRDIEWVIFDEVHYVNDTDRGVVWEEVIIMLPEHVSMVFLSATTPNTVEFSEWIGRTKQRPVHVISTLKRPVPLKHHVYLEGDLYALLDNSGKFMQRSYSEAAKVFKAKVDKKSGGRSNPGGKNASKFGYAQRHDKAQWTRLCKLLKDRQLLPVVVFAFSKKLCESCSVALSSVDFTDGAEKSKIHVFIEESVKRLHGSDRLLPQVLQLRGLLMRGIGVHHGGLLPIMKEVVEILFSRGLVKVLFATETFAMGVNMPARTVIFNGVRKHDGRGFRDLMPGEYIQMSGRAGRRGLDKEGMVIIASWAGLPDAGSLHTMLTGEATKLHSQFRLTYTMLLNLLRVEDMSVTDMMRRSFSEFRTQRALGGRDLPGLLRRAERRLARLDSQAAALDCEYGGDMEVDDYVDVEEQATELAANMLRFMLKSPLHAPSVLCAGRLVTVDPSAVGGSGAGTTPLAAVVLEYLPPTPSAGGSQTAQALVLVLCPDAFKPPARAVATSPAGIAGAPPMGMRMGMGMGMGMGIKSRGDDDDEWGAVGGGKKKGKKGRRGGGGGGGGSKSGPNPYVPGWFDRVGGIHLGLVKTDVSHIRTATACTARVRSRSILEDGDTSAVQSLAGFLTDQEAMGRHTWPPVDPPTSDFDLADAYMTLKSLRQRASTSKCLECPRLPEMRTLARRRRTLRKQIKLLRQRLSNESLSLFPDFQQRLDVLETLGYVNADGAVALKGRVAAQINTADELLLTEMIFESTFGEMEPEEIVALLSALVFQAKTTDEPTLTKRLEGARTAATEIAISLGAVQMTCGLDIIPSEYARSVLKFGLMEVVYEWARGVPFRDICTLTSVQEGIIVRTITRLDETCREVRNAARVVGDSILYRKMEAASEAIKRDIVFASSLYVA